MPTIYLLTGSMSTYSNAWLKYNSPQNENINVDDEGNITSGSAYTSPQVTDEQIAEGASTASIPIQIFTFDLYEDKDHYYQNDKEGTDTADITFMPNVSTASSVEILNWITDNVEHLASMSIATIEDAS